MVQIREIIYNLFARKIILKRDSKLFYFVAGARTKLAQLTKAISEKANKSSVQLA